MSDVSKLIALMARLREPQGGCPWDIEQTFHSIAPYTIEEAYEVADAISRNSMDDLCEELGDLMFQVVFHARMAEEQGAFTFTDVIDKVVTKMVSRHPHVFGDEEVADATAQTVAWEHHKEIERAQKRDEGEPRSLLAGVALGLPALMRAGKLQKRAARGGFVWPDAVDVLDGFEKEIETLREELAMDNREALHTALGNLLFGCTLLGHCFGIDAEGALRHRNAEFEQGFRTMETALEEKGISVEGEDMATFGDYQKADDRQCE